MEFELRPGDVATIVGRSGAACARMEDVAADAGTIANELVSRLGPRLPRIYRS
ncbi:alanine racemase C-terminal domain-containing protein [Enorma phocaeensis]|uniref:alanine racemase C-terminal domain-containing protein n=1 Tax=Enorma phocaeensis TaxID=1871019 RepID=UPI00195ECDA1|nr:hypothetical protein [Enorma phocaeensis]